MKTRRVSVSVVILGFGGGTIEVMQPIIEWYTSTYPRWTVAAYAGPCLREWDDEQQRVGSSFDSKMDELEEVIRSSARAVVHVMSNNGHFLWLHLLRRSGELLATRVGVMVYDCGAARKEHFTHEMIVNIWMRWVTLLVSLNRRKAQASHLFFNVMIFHRPSLRYNFTASQGLSLDGLIRATKTSAYGAKAQGYRQALRVRLARYLHMPLNYTIARIRVQISLLRQTRPSIGRKRRDHL